MPEPSLGSGFEGNLDPATRRAIFDLRRVITPTAWTAVTFENSWVDFGAGSRQVCQYRKVGDMVQLRETMKSGTLAATAFTLPVGFRPPDTLDVIVRAGSVADLANVTAIGQFIPYVADKSLVSIDFQFSVTP